MPKPVHQEWLKEGVKAWNKRRKRIDFSPNLSGVNFFNNLPPDFRESPKTSRTFERINLSGADLRGSDLSHLNFQGADFTGADLREADLSLSNFDNAKFKDADLSFAACENSTFAGAVFERTIANGFEFEQSEVASAKFIGLDLRPEQIGSLERQGAQVFASRQDYQASVSGPRIGFRLSTGIDSTSTDDNRRTSKNRYDVFFGTNREPIIERGALSGFKATEAEKLSFGLCEVTVPEGHRVGSLGSPLWKRLVNMKDDRLRLDSIISLDEELFFQHIIASTKKMKNQERATIFIHGFNNSFEDAVMRAAQIGYDLGIGQGVGLFSWPSKGRKLSYSADERAAEASKYSLADFVEKFLNKSAVSGVNIIAHSMGCRCLLGAMEVLSRRENEVLEKVNQVILAAADVDTGIMPKLAQASTKYSTRTTSYVSGHDKALKLSGWLHEFPRVGFIPPTFVMSGMDTVLVNNDDLGTLAHGYIGSSRTVLSDIFALLARNDEPSERFTLEDTRLGYWRIKT
ncbi:alpha/beta hydrolase [Sulfitobacter mediterraneus]|uniref:alpha/beta hydrolase n=1 Tax=Sulfitobacter mediterraneus TaxID=83219 RepID=UPI001932DFAE|nr:alpha/beta hydrolase [Sulfitobacter mediterraneus]MBM1633494.1 alpha/beta hydrolase [Sulfitobacter mediterraneus]MBM1641991.1 alpha/beta hydrolase [Sulfitobacter mediterraneus]MBM1645358.1 alpha/beta hydrolase [Sulfitobacter mediterraneus]MBM1650110.1 alpha/beta hydrolase [Sulfitobacter mediterraneus]MBM1653427.1 alpha/beta hydrolase [Sulfitobacter mediterraneus]